MLSLDLINPVETPFYSQVSWIKVTQHEHADSAKGFPGDPEWNWVKSAP